MSAIFGIFNKGGGAVDSGDTSVMLSMLTQYGRDGSGVMHEDAIALGSCLNRVGVCSENEVPVLEDDRYILVSDLLVYNREELMQELCISDSKVSNQHLLLEAYKKWGEECPLHINGDFSFAIWEKLSGTLYVCSDHLGVRPLFYYDSPSVFAFATDYRALLALSFVPDDINEATLYTSIDMKYRCAPSETYFLHIRRLRQAHYMQVRENGISEILYWQPGRCNTGCTTDEEYIDTLRELVIDAVHRRVNSVQKKIGSQMSGGLDSSVISALAARELKRQGQGKLPLFSWSPTYELIGKQRTDERRLVEELCEQEGLDCSFYDQQEVEESEHVGPVSSTLQNIMRVELKKCEERDIRLMLTGWGGDEGVSHSTTLFELFLHRYYLYFIKESWKSAGSGLLKPLRFIKKIICSSVCPFFKPFIYFANVQRGFPSFVTKNLAARMKKYTRLVRLHRNGNQVKRITSGLIQTRTDMTAWIGADHNVQFIFPYLDYRLVDFALSTPRSLFFKNGINRYIYRKAFEYLLPPNLCYLKTKDEDALVTFFLRRKLDYFTDSGRIRAMINEGHFLDYVDWHKLLRAVEEIDDEVDHADSKEVQALMRMTRPLEVCLCLLNVQRSIKSKKLER